MRWTRALGPLLTLVVGACFEDAAPIDDTTAMQSSGSECTPGTESCPCIDGACVADLMCLSNTCVSAPSGSDDTSTGPGPATSDSGPATTTPATSDSGPATSDSGPATSDSSSGLPPGSPCDPLENLCELGYACVGLDPEGFFCDFPGRGDQGVSCDADSLETCAEGLLCVTAEVLDGCVDAACCTMLCEVDGGSACPTNLNCSPFYPPGQAPPGYDHVGICVV